MAVERGPIEWALLPVKRYAQFSGRSSRAEYWWFTLAFLLVGFLFDAADWAVGSDIGLFGLAYSLAFIVPSLAVSVRRLHDIGRSGWWFLVVFVPAVFFGFQTALAGLTAEFDPTAPPASMMTSALLLVVGCLVFVVFTLLPGDRSGNRFGPDPYGPDAAKPILT